MLRWSILLTCLAACGSLPRYAVTPVGEGVDTERLRALHAEYGRPILVLDGRLYVPDARCCGEAGPDVTPPLVRAGGGAPAQAPPPGAVGLALDDSIEVAEAEPELDPDGLRCVLAEDGSRFDLEGALEDGQQLYFWDGERLRRAPGFGVPLR